MLNVHFVVDWLFFSEGEWLKTAQRGSSWVVRVTGQRSCYVLTRRPAIGQWDIGIWLVGGGHHRGLHWQTDLSPGNQKYFYQFLVDIIYVLAVFFWYLLTFTCKYAKISFLFTLYFWTASESGGVYPDIYHVGGGPRKQHGAAPAP